MHNQYWFKLPAFSADLSLFEWICQYKWAVKVINGIWEARFVILRNFWSFFISFWVNFKKITFAFQLMNLRQWLHEGFRRIKINFLGLWCILEDFLNAWTRVKIQNFLENPLQTLSALQKPRIFLKKTVIPISDDIVTTHTSQKLFFNSAFHLSPRTKTCFSPYICCHIALSSMKNINKFIWKIKILFFIIWCDNFSLKQ